MIGPVPFHHDPVLLAEIESLFLGVKNPKVVIDATLGLGGHSEMMLSHLGVGSTLIGIDRDADNLVLARERLEGKKPEVTKHFLHASFADIDSILLEKGIGQIDFALYDLGVSSAHYDDGDRGFSIRTDAPLDMRFDRSEGQTARDLVMTLSEYELRKILFDYADEKKAVFIARAIVEARKTSDIGTTFDLLRIIESASFDKHSPKRVFQALRIAVNREFEHIETSLKKTIDRLAIGGILAVITFHSIEDRIVKNLFAPYFRGVVDEITGRDITPAVLGKYTKKPIEPTPAEIEKNPRSRSAKLRIVQKIN